MNCACTSAKLSALLFASTAALTDLKQLRSLRSLEDLFVKESARGLGVGKALFRYLGQICKEKKLPRMDWYGD